MNIFLWVLQAVMAIAFIYSGICKSLLPEKKLVGMGQTGVEGLSVILIKFIGICEICGAVGLIVPLWSNISPALTPVSAFCLALIMPPAAVIHYKRKEPGNVRNNTMIFLICLFIVYGRRALLGL